MKEKQYLMKNSELVEKKDNDLISIIIPVYNVEKYLDRCMDSIINQTHKNLEIILVDDGSTDSSGIICDKYLQKDKRIKVIHKENGGLSSARNAGLKKATGDYIGFVDSDDWVSQDFYSYLYNLIIKYNAGIAMCDYFITDGFGIPEIEKEEIKELNNNDLMNLFFRTKGERSNSSVWNRLYKKEIINDVQFPDGYVNEDVFFSYFVFLKTERAILSNLSKYNYFINNQGITRGALRNQDTNLYYVWDRVVEHAKKSNSVYYENAVLNRQRAIFTLLSKYVVYGIQDYDLFTNQWIKNETKQLRKAYWKLMKTKFFDIKRKIVLSLLCLSPKLLHISYFKFKNKKDI